MATFTLTELREAADKKYAPTIIEAGDERFVLPSILRMSREARKNVIDLVERAEGLAEDEKNSEIEEQLEVFSELLATAEEGGKGERLLELIGDDTAVLIDLVTAWLKDSQAGEA